MFEYFEPEIASTVFGGIYIMSDLLARGLGIYRLVGVFEGITKPPRREPHRQNYYGVSDQSLQGK